MYLTLRGVYYTVRSFSSLHDSDDALAARCLLLFLRGGKVFGVKHAGTVTWSDGERSTKRQW